MAKYLPKLVIPAHKSAVAASQADVEIHEITSPVTGLIHSIQAYCTAIVAAASCVVKKNGTAITAAITPVAGTPSVEAPIDPFVAAGDSLTVHVTTDAGGSFTDLTVLIIIKEQESITTI